MTKRVAAAVFIAVALIAVQLPAQISPNHRIEVLNYYDSGEVTNPGVEIANLHQHTFNYPGASSLRVIFGQWALGPNDYIEVSSLVDGQTHRLGNAELAKWQGTSAWLNGDTITIDLYVEPGSVASFETLSYFVRKGGPIMGVDTICGTVDDRVVTTDFRVARFDGGCTIWLASADNCALSAGHCFSGGSLTVAEFNVPASTSSGGLVSPPIEDQFPVDASTISFTNGGVGNDWGVCKLLTNNLGQTAVGRYGVHFTLSTLQPTSGDPIRITGCGTASPPVENQVLQTHVGPLNSVNFSSTTQISLNYMTDTTGGNSGSPVIDETSGFAVGIHTHGGCTSTGGGNSGTHLSHANFQTAFNALCNVMPMAPTADFSAASTTVLDGQAVVFQDISQGVPTSWAWDFENDGIDDDFSANPSHVYPAPGTYSVKLTVTNALGTDSITKTGYITVNAVSPASVPYNQDFNAGLPLTGEWFFQSDVAAGRIQTAQSGTVSPVSGGDALVMDSSVNTTYATNEAILLIDLASSGGGVLRYWFKETSDEDDPEDGVFLSDGVNEILLQSHQAAPSTWTEFTIDLTSVAAANGMTLTSAMRIIFRQRDNYGFPTDGHFIDDIDVLAPAVPDIGQPNAVNSSLEIVGMVDQSGFTPQLGQNGPFFASFNAGDEVVMNITGPSNGAFQLIFGLLNRNNYFWAPAGWLDIGNGGAVGDFSDLTLWIDGTQPNLGILNALGVLPVTGESQLRFTLPPFLAPGQIGAFQCITHLNLRFTAAVAIELQ